MTITQELVINFHMTESCNYRCAYCYATWNNHCHARELHRQSDRVEQLLELLASYFFAPNSIQQALGYETVRINFAGGEPMLLGERFVLAVTQARALGFNTSIITNGHFLDKVILDKLAAQLSVLGISYDSMAANIVRNIGRLDRKGKFLTPDKLVGIARSYKALNPSGILKINTVVNACNWRDNLLDLMEEVQPDKWKLLRVLPVHDHNLVISETQYRKYVNRHAQLAHLIAEEDNEAMKHSYLMISPEGCFYQNGEAGEGYQQSLPILDVGVEKALSDVHFDVYAFSRRYQSLPQLVV